MKLRNVCSVVLSLFVLAAAAGAQERGKKRAVNPGSPPVTLAQGQKVRLVVGAWDLNNDGNVVDSKGGVSLTLNLLPYIEESAVGGLVRLRQAGALSSGPVLVPVGQIVRYEWDLNNDGQFGWDLNNDGIVRAAVEGANIYADNGTYTIYADNRSYSLSLSLEVVDKQTGKVVLRIGGNDWD